MLKQITDCGFSEAQAQAALKRKSTLEGAIQWILSSEGAFYRKRAATTPRARTGARDRSPRSPRIPRSPRARMWRART